MEFFFFPRILKATIMQSPLLKDSFVAVLEMLSTSVMH
jgi:hypothetical protein